MADDPLTWLQSFYLSLCDDDWEHSYGCEIGNIDNPGWTFKFDLTDTPYQSITLERTLLERSEDDWCDYRKNGPIFEGACGPQNLSELISCFRQLIDNVPTTGAQE